jgi:IS1 family transposase
MTGVAKKTVERLLVAAGQACTIAHDKLVRNVAVRFLQMDEIWSYVGCKESHLKRSERGNGRGDCWVWVGIDPETKLIVSYHIGSREAADAMVFAEDVAARVVGKIQISTDGLKAYKDAIENAFGIRADLGSIVKIYGQADAETRQEVRYSPLRCTEVKRAVVAGEPDPSFICTSHVQRQNLTIRMSNRRFTRLTNAFSKKRDNHEHSIAIHFMYYNFCRIHQSLRVTPAMAAGLTDRVWEISDLVKLIDSSM